MVNTNHYLNRSEIAHKRALSDQEASQYIGMSESWLRHARVAGPRKGRLSGPCFIKMGRTVRYLIEDLDHWLEQFQRLEHLAQHDSKVNLLKSPAL